MKASCITVHTDERNAGDIKKRRQTRTLTAGPTRTFSVNGRSNLVGAYVGGVAGRGFVAVGGDF
jgi:hypothetical protein